MGAPFSHHPKMNARSNIRELTSAMYPAHAPEYFQPLVSSQKPAVAVVHSVGTSINIDQSAPDPQVEV